MTKNKASMRTLPLIPEIKTLLNEVYKKQQKNRRTCRLSYCKDYLDYICVDELGNLLKPDYLTQHLQVVLERRGLKHIRFHDLRHSCASLMFANGVSLKEIQEWLGHSDYGTTVDIKNSHIQKNLIAKAA